MEFRIYHNRCTRVIIAHPYILHRTNSIIELTIQFMQDKDDDYVRDSIYSLQYRHSIYLIL